MSDINDKLIDAAGNLTKEMEGIRDTVLALDTVYLVMDMLKRQKGELSDEDIRELLKGTAQAAFDTAVKVVTDIHKDPSIFAPAAALAGAVNVAKQISPETDILEILREHKTEETPAVKKKKREDMN